MEDLSYLWKNSMTYTRISEGGALKRTQSDYISSFGDDQSFYAFHFTQQSKTTVKAHKKPHKKPPPPTTTSRKRVDFRGTAERGIFKTPEEAFQTPPRSGPTAVEASARPRSARKLQFSSVSSSPARALCFTEEDEELTEMFHKSTLNN
jgi:hypothetical protein